MARPKHRKGKAKNKPVARTDRSDETSERDELVKQVTEIVKRRIDHRVPFAELEEGLMDDMNEVVRRVLEDVLNKKADGYPDEVGVRDARWRRHCLPKTASRYDSLVGPLMVRRWTYRRVGVRNGPTIVPVELEMGLIDRMTPALARSVAVGYASGPMRRYRRLLESARRCPPPHATLQRRARAIGKTVVNEIERISPVVRDGVGLPDGAHAICLGLDRTGVPMEELLLPGEEPKKPRKRRRRPRIRRPRSPIEVNYRMAYVGVVYVVGADPDAPPLHVVRFSATAEEGPAQIVRRMLEQVEHWRSRKPSLPVLVVQDGAPEMWNRLLDGLRTVAPDWKGIVDWYHVTAHLSDAASCICADEVATKKVVARWKRILRRSATGHETIAAELDEHAEHRCGHARTRLQQHANYFYFSTHMNYARFVRKRWPIGSGVLEATCKTVVKARANLSGQRWKPPGLAAVLTLRALQESDALNPTIDVLLDRHCARVA